MEPTDTMFDENHDDSGKQRDVDGSPHFGSSGPAVSKDLAALDGMGVRDRELFSRALNTLFSGGFILNQLERDRPLYRFILSHYSVFETYLGFAEWSLRRDESLGVIAIKGPANAKHALNLDETIGLLVLRVLYEEKRNEISLARENAVRQYEFQNKFKVLSDRVLGKTRLVGMLRRFRTLKLIAIRGEETDPEAILVLYPSIAFALDGESIDDITDRIENLTASVDDAEEPTGDGDTIVELVDDRVEHGERE